MLKKLIKSLIPKQFLLVYHKALAILANLYYRFPSHKLIVIGVTGTKGKSSTALMITRILEEAGHKIGSSNTIFFKVADKEWPNNTKQGMPGRFKLQKLLSQMVGSGCTHAVIEVTSEGILQHRHWGIAFDIAVFTNLSPEHIEAHGSFANYREAKALIFKNLNSGFRKTMQKQKIKKVIVANRLDSEAPFFLKFPADEKWGVWGTCLGSEDIVGEKKLCAANIQETGKGASFTVEDRLIQLSLPGAFMASNAMLAMAAAFSLGVSVSACKDALEKISFIPGRLQAVEAGQDFKVVVDYAHEPRSFESVLELGRKQAESRKLIVVFGVTGGGRDRAKRPIMGALAAKYADNIILTTDDPYNDDPKKLIDDIAPGIAKSGAKWHEGQNWWRVADRREAIKKAFQLAASGDVVLLLGKGSEQVMAIGGKLLPWSDEEVARELLNS